MRTTWLLIAMTVGLWACKGDKGDPGPAGNDGRQGPPGPSVTIDGLDGGTVHGDSQVVGSLTVSGGLVAGGTMLTYARPPLVLAGVASDGCRIQPAAGSGSYNGNVTLPVRFPANPVVLATIDETNDDYGPSWVRLLHLAPNRISFLCDLPADAIHWFAIEPGVHTIDGKRVEAGIVSGPVSGGNVSFPAAFPTPPVVLLQIDESGDNVGGQKSRVIGNPTTSGFQYWIDSNSDALHWVAFEPGTYVHGRYRWTAGTIPTNNTCTVPCTFSFPTALSTAPEALVTVNDVDNAGADSARLYKVTPAQLQVRLNGGSTENLFYLLLEDLN